MYGVFMTFTLPSATALLIMLAGSVCAAEPTQEADGGKGWEYAIAAGAIYTPNYLGDDHYRLNLFPDFSVRYKRSAIKKDFPHRFSRASPTTL